MPDSYVTTTLAASGQQGSGRRLAQLPAPAPAAGGGGNSDGLAVNSQARQCCPLCVRALAKPSSGALCKTDTTNIGC